MKPVIVGMTGASGTIYGLRLVQALTQAGRQVALVVSDSARLVIQEEQGKVLRNPVDKASWKEWLDDASLDFLEIFPFRDFTAPVASGSYPAEAMIIMPCSMGTLGAIASGISQNLIHRAADCTLKEGRPLILVPRETPLNAIHLENMLKLSRIGVRIVPAMPGFYAGASSVEELVDFMVGKVLDQLGIFHTLYPRWTGKNSGAESKGRIS